MTKIKWADEPEDKDFAAAEEYLSLFGLSLSDTESVKETTYKAKDLLRASGLTPLEPHDDEVMSKTEKIESGEELAPLIVFVRIDKRPIIADGFHRLSAAFWHDQDTKVRCAVYE